MSKVIINVEDGTVCDLNSSVVVELKNLDALGQKLWDEWLEGGNDGTASELGTKYGTAVQTFTDNELNYGNSIAFSGKALREEVEQRLECGYDSDEYKLASTFTDEQFDQLGQYILSSDYLWNVFTEELNSGIVNYTNDVLGKRETQ